MYRTVFVTGATGYIGQALVPALVARGHRVRALARAGSAQRVPTGPGVDTVVGNALDASTFAAAVGPADTLVHLVGTPHPNPAKAGSFQAVDLVSVQAAVEASLAAGVQHLVYVSVAQPAPVMQAYVAVRQAGERLIREAGLPATFVRPWYVLGPGHRWPWLLAPGYALLRLFPPTREDAMRLGLVTLAQMVQALVGSVEQPPTGIRIVDVPGIRRVRPAGR